MSQNARDRASWDPQDMSGPAETVTVVDDAYKNSLPGGIEVVILNPMSIRILITANLRVLHESASDTVLDGGRLAFLDRPEASARQAHLLWKKREWCILAGFARPMVSMVVVMYNDIVLDLFMIRTFFLFSHTIKEKISQEDHDR